MVTTFRLYGSIVAAPALGVPSGVSGVSIPLQETLALMAAETRRYVLLTDDPVVVSLGGLTAVHVLLAQTDGNKVRLRLTSTDGTNQALPVDPTALLFARSVPFSAVELTRVSGVATTVDLYLGQKA